MNSKNKNILEINDITKSTVSDSKKKECNNIGNKKRIYNPVKVGDKFGKLTIFKKIKKKGQNGCNYYKCICDCGGNVILCSSSFKRKWKKLDCGCWRNLKKQRHIGEKINGLEIIGISKRKSRYYTWFAICKCICGKIKEIRYADIKSERNKTCGCRSIKTHLGCVVKSIGKNNKSWTGYEEMSGQYLTRLKRSAVIRKYEYKLNPKYIWNLYIKQNKKCALSGIEIRFCTNNQTASLDRINNNKGYIKGNVWWVHKDINNMKQTFDKKYFIKLCERVSNENKL